MNQIRIVPLLSIAAVLAFAACGGGEDAGEAAAPGTDTTAAPAAAAPAPAPATPADTTAAASPSATGSFLDPNTASAQELMTVPGFDQPLADAVVAGRPYADMTAVDRVLAPRLSEAQRDTAYTRLWKPLNLNSATAAEIELIPGVAGRMRHEFEEYRPYRNIEQFRREIGKYVNEAEVARLERYVTLN